MKKGKQIGIEFSGIREKTDSGYTSYEYLIRELSSGKAVGDCCLRAGDGLSDVGNLGYTVDPDFRGRGYAAEAAELLLCEARELGFAEVTVVCRGENLPSRRVCEKIGGVATQADGQNLITYKIKL